MARMKNVAATLSRGAGIRSGVGKRRRTPGLIPYQRRGRTWWRIDASMVLPDGKRLRVRERRIPTREQAEVRLGQIRKELYEQGHFKRLRPARLTVKQALDAYVDGPGREAASWQSDRARAETLKRHLGKREAASLTEADVVGYRGARRSENTRRGGPPKDATLDREVELLKRALNYAVRCKKIRVNPLRDVKLLRTDNVRQMVISRAKFEEVLQHMPEVQRVMLLVLFETGMRRREAFELEVKELNLEEGLIDLPPGRTKTNEARRIYLTKRTVAELKSLLKSSKLKSPYVFVNPQTRRPYQDIRRSVKTALKSAGLEGAWLHDLRRSFVTHARKEGIPESVVMKMSGHRTRAVFDRYNIVDDEDVRKAALRIEKSRSRQDLGKAADQGDPENDDDPPKGDGSS